LLDAMKQEVHGGVGPSSFIQNGPTKENVRKPKELSDEEWQHDDEEMSMYEARLKKDESSSKTYKSLAHHLSKAEIYSMEPELKDEDQKPTEDGDAESLLQTDEVQAPGDAFAQLADFEETLKSQHAASKKDIDAARASSFIQVGEPDFGDSPDDEANQDRVKEDESRFDDSYEKVMDGAKQMYDVNSRDDSSVVDIDDMQTPMARPDTYASSFIETDEADDQESEDTELKGMKAFQDKLKKEIAAGSKIPKSLKYIHPSSLLETEKPSMAQIKQTTADAKAVLAQLAKPSTTEAARAAKLEDTYETLKEKDTQENAARMSSLTQSVEEMKSKWDATLEKEKQTEKDQYAHDNAAATQLQAEESAISLPSSFVQVGSRYTSEDLDMSEKRAVEAASDLSGIRARLEGEMRKEKAASKTIAEELKGDDTLRKED